MIEALNALAWTFIWSFALVVIVGGVGLDLTERAKKVINYIKEQKAKEFKY